MDQQYCEVENTDPAQHSKWLDKHGFKPDENGKFPVADFEGKNAVENDQLFQNIRDNVSFGDYIPLYTQPYDERIFVMVCGGPSLADHLDELKAKSLEKDKYCIVCSNMTGGYLLENNIVADVHFILDPQEKKKFDVVAGKTHMDTQYWINVACNKSVFDELRSQNIKPYAFLADFEDRPAQFVTEDDGILRDILRHAFVVGALPRGPVA